MGLSPLLSTFQLKQCCCLKPPGARLTLIHSAGSTDCHSSCQSTPIYLKGSRLLRRSRQGETRAGGRQGRWERGRWWRKKGVWRRGLEAKGCRRGEKVGQGLPRYGAGFGIQHFHICDGASWNRISGMPFMSAFFDLFSGFWRHKWRSRSKGGERKRGPRRGLLYFDNLSLLSLLLSPAMPVPIKMRAPDLTIKCRRQALAPLQKSRAKSPSSKRWKTTRGY